MLGHVMALVGCDSTEPVLRDPTPSYLRVEREPGEAELIGYVELGTSREEETDSGCVHRMVVANAHTRVPVELRVCDWFPQGFHEQRALEVRVLGHFENGVLQARLVLPNLGSCCGGPHCYPS